MMAARLWHEEFRIEAARLEDVPALCTMEQGSGSGSGWTASAFTAELKRPHAILDVVRPVAGGAALAYLCAWVVAGEIQILNLVTDPAQRRRGHARHLLMHLIARARTHGYSPITLDVRRDNHAALALYTALGFRSTGVRPGYYADGEDALLLDLVP